jgi:hypothetical protein
MAPTNGVILPESMADILVNPVDTCFGSMPVKFTTSTACLVIEANTITSNQQVGTDLLTETNPPTPSDLIVRINRVEGMLSDTIITIQHASWPAERSSRNITLHEAQDPDRIWTQDTRSWKPQKSPR